MTAPRMARCPQCGQPTVLDTSNRFRPFCSERCKLLDFGAWASGKYSIPAVEDDGDADGESAEQEKQRLQ
jgi:endogenous inhibitor of DNA gyrase (YacG/DUF329 family)